MWCFFFQAEDGIRDWSVTGVQTCALPISMENRLYPMRELLADMLMAQGDPAAALKEYESSLKNAPMRLRGFYGAAKAAEASGDAKKAHGYFEKLARLTRHSDGDRPEVREVKQRM